MEIAQSFALDNGAYPAWRAKSPITEWSAFYAWADDLRMTPNCDWAIIPDIIDGTEEDNNKLIEEWPLPKYFGVPVWHMHESFSKLEKLVNEWPRVAIGSSGEFATVGNRLWWCRMYDAMCYACDSLGRPKTKLHGLRMLNPKVFSKLPLSSADSTNIGRNIGIDKAWYGSYPPSGKSARASVMRGRIENENSPATFNFAEIFNEYLYNTI